VYPPRFRYEAPTSLDDAIALLAANPDAKILAGGQSLIPMMKLRFATPPLLVDINNIAGLDQYRADADGSCRIGALCRHAQLERSETLPALQPTIAAAAPLIADPIVRTRGTLVGSLCHADPQGDWASAMVSLGASITALGPSGGRSIAVADLVRGPFQTVLAPDEIAVEAAVPAARGARAGGYLKLERRIGDFATVGVAVSLEIAAGAVANAGIGLTGVGPVTVDASEAAAALLGSSLDSAAVESAAGLAAQAAQPRSDHRGSADYKRHVVATFVQRICGRISQAQQEAA